MYPLISPESCQAAYPSLRKPNSKLTAHRVRMNEYATYGLPATILYGPNYNVYLKERYNKESCNVNIGLNDGYNVYNQKPKGHSFDELLQFIIDEKQIHSQYSLKDAVCYGNFVIRRGLLKRLMLLAYEPNTDGITFVVKQFQDILFIKEVRSEEQQKVDKFKRYVHEYWPYKFKHALTTVNGIERSKIVNSYNQLQGAFILKLADEKNEGPIIFYGSQLDAFDSKNNHIIFKSRPEYVESDYQVCSRYRSWWLDGFLTGASDIIVGHRNHSAVVTRIEKLKLPTLQKRMTKKFDSNLCFNNINLFLHQMKSYYRRAVEDGQSLFFDFKPEKTVANISIVPDSQYPVLTKEFINTFSV